MNYSSNFEDPSDWFDKEKVAQRKERHLQDLHKIMNGIKIAKEEGDENACKAGYRELAKFKKKDDLLREQAEKAGICW